MFSQWASDFFPTCFVCMCQGGGGGGGGRGTRFSTSPSMKKITDPASINK